MAAKNAPANLFPVPGLGDMLHLEIMPAWNGTPPPVFSTTSTVPGWNITCSMDSTWTSVTLLCKGSKWMIFHLNGASGSTFFAVGRLSLSLSVSLSLSLKGGLWLMPSGICGMEDAPKGMVKQFRLQKVVNRRSCRRTRTAS